MKTKIAINGFGRIGRNAFKIAFERSDMEIVAINDLTETKTLAHLLKHDSNYGSYQYDVSSDEQNILVNDQKIKVLAEKEPVNLPWKDLGVEVVIESTGKFTDPAKAKAHIGAGAKKVVISAPAKGDGAETIVLGVNEDKLDQAGDVISNASCTTNSITPIMAILEANFGIEKAMMTTIHSYTASQVLLDGPAKDIREARNAATNIVPTTTGASIAAAKAMPSLEGVFGGMSVRVPTPVVSLSDFSVVTKKSTSADEVNEALKKAVADPYYQGILDATEEELVSSDFIGNSHSAIIDLKLTAVVGGNLVKVVAWYDNEWGYSNRLVELTADVGRLLHSGSSASDDKAETAKPVETKSAHHHHKGEIDITEPPDEPLLPSPRPDKEHGLLPESVPTIEDQAKDTLPAEDDEKSAVGEDTKNAGYVISEGDDLEKPEDKSKTPPPQHPLPPDATNIDGVHRF
jgi:glyceraldehyde 3-phosphate dehydrogenase